MKIDQIEAGSYVVYRKSDRSHYVLNFLGRQNGEYVFEQRDGRSLEGSELAATVFTDAEGRWRRQVMADGRERVFDPHNCFRELTYCEYTVSGSSGSTFTEARQYFLQDGGYSFEVFRSREGRDAVPFMRGSATIDENGLMNVMTYAWGESGSYQTVTKVDEVYP